MNEHDSHDEAVQNEGDIVPMLKRISRQLEYLEKKVDTLLSSGSQRPSFGHGQGGGRPGHFGRSDRGPRPGGGGFRPDFGKSRRFDRPRQDRPHDQQGPGMHGRGGGGGKPPFRKKKSGFFHQD